VFFSNFTNISLTIQKNFTSYFFIFISHKLKMANWGIETETGGWAQSNPHVSEKGNAEADNWNYGSNEPAGDTGGFNDNYGDGGYKGDANDAGDYGNDKCFGWGEEG
jgi:hypothetical protein